MDKALAFLKSISIKTWIIIAIIVVLIIILILWLKNSGTKTSATVSDTNQKKMLDNYIFSFPLKFGSTGPEVETLQKYLKLKGADLGTFGPNKDGVDGEWGNYTEAAVIKIFGKNVIDQTTFNTTIKS